ncbi:MAG: glycosyltransferase [Anaerolineaceae bacterium]|nr:glycosyltransferase [Anaerolineaceae bacterium]
MKISIVIPTYNRVESLKRVVSALYAQTSYPVDEFELIVVSDGSTDGTIDYLRQLTPPFPLVPIQQKNQGPAAARNTGVGAARGEIILFLDDDVVPAPQLISEHYRLFCEHGDGIVVLGPMITPADTVLSPWVDWEQNMLVKQYEAMSRGDWEPTGRQFYTGNSSVYRRHLLAQGGFDSSFKRAEDVELAFRLEKQGLRFYFNPQAVGYHYAQRSFASWIGIAYAYGSNDVIFHQKKGQTWLLPTIKKEFFQRNPFIRILSNLCVDHPQAAKLAIYLLKQAALISYRLNLKRASGMALSGIYNLRYYQGIADQLGGWKKLFQGNF